VQAPVLLFLTFMRIGVFTPLLSHLSIDDVVKKVKSLGATTFEPGTGNFPGDPQLNPNNMTSKPICDADVS
jgi:hypothetical protein